MASIRTKGAAFALICLCLMIVSAAGSAGEARDILDIPSCEYCGMYRQPYAHSRMLIVYADGTTFGSCSIYCAALNLVIEIGRIPSAIWVADYHSKELVPAEKAWWVIGGARPGVMTKRAKWAFREKKDAVGFIAENGGELASFDAVMQATFEDMYMDTKMIRMKKKIGKMNPY
jgi:copper chaperone NosL